MGLSVYSIFEHDKERQFTIASLERIGTRVNWEKSEAIVDLLNEPSDVSPSEISVQVKLFPRAGTTLPVESLRILQELHKRCQPEERWKYEYLNEPDAEIIFRHLKRTAP